MPFEGKKVKDVRLYDKYFRILLKTEGENCIFSLRKWSSGGRITITITIAIAICIFCIWILVVGNFDALFCLCNFSPT